MNEDYDYKVSLNNIKANLFDIYEDQERIIGELGDSSRNQLNNFIKVKDMALNLVNSISDLYDEDTVVLENPEDNTSVDDNSGNQESSDNDIEFSDNDNDDDSINNISIDNNKKDETLDKYYLECDEKKLNFAYVPESLLNVIKKNGTKNIEISKKEENESTNDLDDNELSNNQEDEFNEEQSVEESNKNEDIDTEDVNNDTENTEEIEENIKDDSKLYKTDSSSIKIKGIIVRNDQYMKLALSKHRQEGVLKEAKNYRIEMVKKNRADKQREALKKGEVHIDI